MSFADVDPQERHKPLTVVAHVASACSSHFGASRWDTMTAPRNESAHAQDTEHSTMWRMWPWHAAGLRPASPGLVDASRRRGRAIVALIAAAGSVVLGMAIVQMLRVPITTPLVLLLACTVASGWATLRMRYVPISFSVSDTFHDRSHAAATARQRAPCWRRSTRS